MIKKTLYITGLIGVFMVAGGVSLKAAEKSGEASGYEKFRIIAQRNIFSRDRRPEREERDRPMRAKSVILSLYILRGTVNNAGEYTAFIEEQISGDSIKAKVGTEFFGGKITGIQYGRVVFEKNDVTKIVRIGEEFGKQETTQMVSADEIEQESALSEPAQETEEQSGSEDDILKKLMERRKSQLSD